MTDQPTRTGFEAYFDTDDFEKGVKRFKDGIDEARQKMGELYQGAGRPFGFMDYTDEIAHGLSRAFGVVGPLVEKELTPMGAQMGDTLGTSIGDAAVAKSGEMILVGLVGAITRGGGIERVGAAIGSALGYAIGQTVAPGLGGTVGAMLGSSIGGTARGAISLMAGVFGPIGSGLAYLGFLAVDTVKFIGRAFEGLVSVFGAVLSPIIAVGERIFGAVGAVAEDAFGRMGKFARDAINDIVREFERLVGEVARLQEIEAGLGALVRSALVVSQGYDDATQAIAAAIPITEQLSGALAMVALQSPFTIEQINSIFRVNTAFGIAIDLSLELTEAMVQFGAATGFGADSLNLIARNLAQIAKFGQVYRRDIYQLANAGVDLAQIVRQELGISIEELNQGLLDGTYIMNDLMRAFVNFAQTNFAGAAEDLSKTIVGLQNRLETLKVLVMQDFLGPIIEQVTQRLDVLFDAMARVWDTGVFEVFGQTVADILSAIVGDVDWTIENLSTKIMEFMLWIAETASTMARYGFGMMEAWGWGMLQGAFQAISAVVNFISTAITSLFATHSPPKILPMIDVWGAETIQAWLEGMTRADFGVINRVISPIESALRNIGLEQPEILGNLQQVTKRLSESLSAGTADESLFSFIGQIAGPYGSAIKELTRLEFELASAIKAVAEAQEGLNQATKMYEDSDEAVRRLVREYNNLLRAGASDDILDAKLKEIRAAQGQRKEAAELIKEREEELDIAKENQKEAEDMTETQRDMVNLMIRLTQSTKDLGGSLKDLGGSLRGVSGDLANLAGGFGDLSNIASGFSDELQGKLELLKARIEIVLNRLRMDVEDFMEQVRGFFRDDDGSFQTMLTNIEGLGEAFKEAGGFMGIAEEILNQWEIFKLRLELVGIKAEMVWSFLKEIVNILIDPWNMENMVDFQVHMADLRDREQEVLDKLGELTGDALPTLNDELRFLETPLGDVATGLSNIDSEVSTLDTNTNTFTDNWGGYWKSIKDDVERDGKPVESVINGIAGAINNVISAMAAFLRKLPKFLAGLLKIKTPSALRQDSPSPFEQSLIDLRGEMEKLSKMAIPDFTAKLNLIGNANDIMNFQPTPTSAYVPSAISSTVQNNTFNMGGNVVRDDMDLAIINNNVVRTMKQATYGV